MAKLSGHILLIRYRQVNKLSKKYCIAFSNNLFWLYEFQQTMDFIVYMHQAPKRYRFPVSIISHTAWLYHRFNNSYRYIQEQMLYRGIILSYETIRSWCDKFSFHFKEVIKKREYRPKDKWHLDEMSIRINGEYFILWRAVDSDKYELDVFLQKRRNKQSAIRF